MAKSKGFIIKNDYKEIKRILSTKSKTIDNYLEENSNSSYSLIRKYITHSDLLTSGKMTKSDQSFEKNILYYLTLDEMKEIEKKPNEKFETAKQSNIFVPLSFYEFLEVPIIQRRSGQQETRHNHPNIHEYANVYLVNDTLKYFSIDYTYLIFEKLKKNINYGKWNNKERHRVELSDNIFTPIELRHAVHGIGTESDVLFHKLRRSIFKNDIFMILLEKKENGEKNVFILLEKNPRFFSIIEQTNKIWEEYNKREEQLNLGIVEIAIEDLEKEKNRKFQNKWRNILAEEIMNFTTVENQVFCPFTYIAANFENVGTLYRASHIKRFEECNAVEAFDINNGLLLVANADALFDKYLISIDEDKNLLFSFLIKQDTMLISRLLLNQPIFKMILNENRMKYIGEHRSKFYLKEEERKQNAN